MSQENCEGPQEGESDLRLDMFNFLRKALGASRVTFAMDPDIRQALSGPPLLGVDKYQMQISGRD